MQAIMAQPGPVIPDQSYHLHVAELPVEESVARESERPAVPPNQKSMIKSTRQKNTGKPAPRNNGQLMGRAGVLPLHFTLLANKCSL